MEFIKNIDKDFILSPDYKLCRINGLNQGDLKVKLKDIDMGGATFVLSDFKNIDGMVDVVVNSLVGELKKSLSKWKRVARKIIEAWETAPNKFHRQKENYSKDTFKNVGLLSDDEYMVSLFVAFEGIYFTYEGFVTGCGEDTFYDKKYHVDALAKIDDWIEKEVKTIQSAKVREKIKKAILRLKIELSYPQVLKYISIPETTVATVKTKKPKKSKFPMVLDGDVLNSLFYEDMLHIDEDVIAHFKKEYDVDLSPLSDWELSYECDGEHYNDGQICDYTVIFISPEGHSYEAYDSHCLMNGWSFDGPVKIY